MKLLGSNPNFRIGFKMEFRELLASIILESGPEKIYHHYTDMSGLFGILKTGYIQSGYMFTTFNDNLKNQIAVIRPSGSKDLESIAGEEDSKKLVAKFIIQFDVANDKVKSLTVKPINEPAITFERDIERILNQYKVIHLKKEIINNCEKYKSIFSEGDYRKLHNKIYNYLLNLTNKEGEERLFVDKIKLNKSYIKIELLPEVINQYNTLSDKLKSLLDIRLSGYQEMFFKNDIYLQLMNMLERDII